MADQGKEDIVKSIFGRQAGKDNTTISAFLKAGGSAKQEMPKVSPGASIKTFPYGIDIGTSAIKFVQLGKTGDNVIVINDCGVEEFSQAAVADPKEREKETAQILARIVKEHNITGKIYTALPSQEVKTMLFSLPIMPHHEVANAIGWSLRNEAHISLEDYNFDYVQVQNITTSRESLQPYFTVASKKKSAFSLKALLHSLNLKVDAIDVNAIAEIEALALSGQIKKDNNVILVVSLGNAESTLSIVHNGDIYFLRNLTVNGAYVTGAIQKALGVSFAEAELLKKKFSGDITRKEDNNALPELPPLPGEQPASSVEQPLPELPPLPDEKPAQPAANESEVVENELRESLDNLAESINQNFKFFSFQISRSAIKDYNRVILLGGSSLIKPMPQYIEKALATTGAMVDAADFSKSIAFAPSLVTKLGQDYLNNMLPRLVAAIGLSQRGMGL